MGDDRETPPTRGLGVKSMDNSELQGLLDEVLPPKQTQIGGSSTPTPAAYTTAHRAQGIPKPTCETWPSGSRKGVVEVRYTHDAMIDLIIANPAISQNELALYFGYTASWISQIIASDAFQARLAERTEKLVDPLIRTTAEQNFRALVLRSQEILMQKLNRPTEEIPDQLALRALELSSRAAGYGGKEQVVQVTNVHNHLESLGDNLVKLLRRKKSEVIDVEED